MNRRVLVLQLLHDIRDFLAAAVLAQWILRRYTHAVSSSPGCSTSTSSQRNHSSGPGAKDPEGSAFAADCDAMLAAADEDDTQPIAGGGRRAPSACRNAALRTDLLSTDRSSDHRTIATLSRPVRCADIYCHWEASWVGTGAAWAHRLAGRPPIPECSPAAACRHFSRTSEASRAFGVDGVQAVARVALQIADTTRSRNVQASAITLAARCKYSVWECVLRPLCQTELFVKVEARSRLMWNACGSGRLPVPALLSRWRTKGSGVKPK
jgi:hypothetical protein